MINAIVSLVVAAAWIAFLWRGYVVFKRRQSCPGKAGAIPLWLVWVPSFFLLLAGTTFNDLYLEFISTRFGEWFIYVPRVACGIIAFTIGSYACIRLRLLPDDRLPRWREWPIAAGILALVDFALLRWMGWHLFPDRLLNFDHAADLVFRAYLLIATLRIGLPTLRWSRMRESGVISQIRLNILWWFNFFFAVWMGIGILSLGNGFPLLTTPVIVGFWICLILGLFTPDSFYKRRLMYLYHADAFVLIRFVEVLAYFDVIRRVKPEDSPFSWQPSQHRWREIITSPKNATYRSAISLLDAGKILNAQPAETLAGSLGRRMGLVCNDDSDYLKVVDHLRATGFEYLADRRALSAILPGLLATLRQAARTS